MCDIVLMNEIDEQIEELLDKLVANVVVPTDEEGEAAKELQGGIHIVDDNPIDGLAWAADLDKEQRYAMRQRWLR